MHGWKIGLLTAVVAAWPIVAAAQEQQPQPVPRGQTSGNAVPEQQVAPNSAQGVAPPVRPPGLEQKKLSPEDKAFAQEAGETLVFKKRLERAVSEKAVSPQLRQFINKIGGDDYAALDQLHHAESQMDTTLPDELNASDQKELDRIGDMAAADLDQQFMQMFKDRQRSLEQLLQTEINRGGDSLFVSWARTTLPKLQNQDKLAEQLGKESGGDRG